MQVESSAAPRYCGAKMVRQEFSHPTMRWRDLCRRAVARQRDLLRHYTQQAAAQEVTRTSAGGDVPIRIDVDFEHVVIDEIDKAQHALGALHVVTEERGVISYGGADPVAWVIVDPVDGSKNAAQGLPQFSLSVAIARGPTMADVWFAYIYDFGTDEEFLADDRGFISVNGSSVNDASETPFRIVGCESAEPALLALGLQHLADSDVQEIRVVGSIAIALCYVALGRFDGMFTCKECRSVDAAAGQLIARQAGREVSFDGRPPATATLELAGRYRLVAGPRSLLPQLTAAQQSIPLVRR
jgi:myo-inositol-1(or 4)-monophosphatase